MSPLLVLALVQFLVATGFAIATDSPAPEAWHGYLYAVALFVVQCIAGWTTHKYFERGMVCGYKIRSALTSNLYKKCLRLSPKGRQMFSAGRI
ncbi:hypothetical protein HDU76_008019, partial [Blyttiomyces sp. JEL0837]